MAQAITLAKPAALQQLGVVVPLANEEQTIRPFLERVLGYLQAQDRLFCVLDNMSRDQTRAIIAETSARDARVTLVWAPENRCVMDAYFRGYRVAFEQGFDWILEMDGGFSHLPEQIPQFIAGMRQGFDYVGGSRFMPGGCHRSPWTRVFISRGGTWLAQWFLNSKMTDMTSGFECFNRAAMDHILRHGVASRANFFQTEIRHMMHRFRWLEVPIQYQNTNCLVGRSSLREAFQILWQLRRQAKNAC
jgi:dolichol-phosphate mannosyltransferase